MTVSHVHHDNGGRPDHVEIYRGQRFISDLEPSLKIELLAPDDEAADLVRVLGRLAARTDDIWLTEVNLVVRVRTSEYGLDAL